MTDEEIVARAIASVPASRAPAAVLAALREAGRLVPEGCVVVGLERWERVRRVAEAVEVEYEHRYESMPVELFRTAGELVRGDLEPLP